MQRPWLTHYEKEVPQHFEYPSVTLYQVLKDTASEFPENTAMIFFGGRVSYQRLLHLVDSMATALHKLGVSKGTRVAIALPNCPQFVISFYAVLKLGAIVVQTNPRYVERELEHILRDSGAETIIALDLICEKIARIRERTTLRNVIVTSIKEFLPFPLSLLYPIKAALGGHRTRVERGRTIRFGELLRTEREEWGVEINPLEDSALLQYTGGTTGIPKGVTLTHLNLVANTVQTVRWMTAVERGKEVMLAAIPFFHVYGMTVCMNFGVYTGSALVLIPDPKPDEILASIHKYRPTIFPGVPTLYRAINSHPKAKRYKISSIKACISGAAPLPATVKEDFERLTGAKLVEGYGLSEASPVTHCNPIYGLGKPGSIGIPFPGTDAAIIDLVKGEEAPPGEVGELLIRGPQVMKGYWNLPEETRSVLQGGWLYTGDIAKMDEDGYFYIVDRKKELIIASGFKVYPSEVEEVLFAHPKVEEAAVIGVPSEYRGETVKAFIVLKEGMTVSEDELKDYCRQSLVGYKVPEKIEFRDELPKSLIGKVLKRVLIEEEVKK